MDVIAEVGWVVLCIWMIYGVVVGIGFWIWMVYDMISGMRSMDREIKKMKER